MMFARACRKMGQRSALTRGISSLGQSSRSLGRVSARFAARRNGLSGAASQQALLATPIGARNYYEWKVSTSFLKNWTTNEGLKTWILERIRLMQPERVHLCDASDTENKELLHMMEQSGMLIKLNEDIRPNSYLARSSSSDVARVEESTYICSENEEDAGPTNNWRDPEETGRMMEGLFDGSMQGRTMYVVPFSMGPIGSPFSQIGVQITDSPYVVVNMRLMTRMGPGVMDLLNAGTDFIPCVHSVGAPLARNQEDTPWPCNPDHKYIVHFPEQRRIWSYGSGYGGNALLGKKCLALRIASAMAKEEGWLAEHMLIVGITNPEGVKKYFAAAFPSACGKTNLAMLNSPIPGWKIECVGDDIAWMRVGEDGRLWAINPEAGFFGVAPGTSMKSNPNAMLTLNENVIFTNCALQRNGDVYWKDIQDETPKNVQSWLRTEWYEYSEYDAAHPNARFTVAAKQCPVMDAEWDSKQGVPISGIVFGGRRSSTVPLVYQARDWEHGTFMGATMNSETTAAAAGKRGVLRNDPFAMKPFCGYNMGDYFGHWLSFADRTETDKLPNIFHVNWFKKSPSGKFLWPGFGENIRVLEWIFNRCGEDASATATETPIGLVPKAGDIDVEGLDLPAEDLENLFEINTAEWKQEVKRNRQFLNQFGSHLPARIEQELNDLESRL